MIVRTFQPGVAPEDAALLRAAAEGDRDALGQLYDRFAPDLLIVAQRLLGNSREAEDVVHDVFLEAWHRARHYDSSRGSVRTWLMLRLRSRALDRLRARRRTDHVALDEGAAANLPARDEGPTYAGDHDRLAGALAGLPQEQRAVLELGYFAGRSCAEIAQTLCVPIGTVKSRMSRAIAQLRTKLRDHEEARP
jgi:RNA polymerase sigma-70 factor (ECF subfamily)